MIRSFDPSGVFTSFQLSPKLVLIDAESSPKAGKPIFNVQLKTMVVGHKRNKPSNQLSETADLVLSTLRSRHAFFSDKSALGQKLIIQRYSTFGTNLPFPC
ncbi:hypothetical protein L596_021562 [Steinernema carpocapsae]|uniref:Uncharacterized protein n=1 Tax=Steinernema carpocapsae TaxID=34508 RepID=A0A4U5MJ59_STECR|nr:hypothetical protein L596_021562 [Steinernema carpocapsae]